jgi:nitrogen fixation/metabolism regulation signal transduction histidine kinase
LLEFTNEGEGLAKQIKANVAVTEQQLGQYCQKLDVDEIELTDAQGQALVKRQCRGANLVTQSTNLELLLQASAKGKSSVVEEINTASGFDNYRLRAVYRLSSDRYLQLVQTLPPAVGENAHKVQQAYSDYQERALSRIGLRKMYIGSLTLTMFLGLFIAVALALILGRQLAQPLLMLLRGTQAVAEGDLSPKPEINTGDELGLLTRQFNNMTRQLSDARESLQESKDFSESILVNLTAGVCVLDANYNLMIANAGAKRILERDLTPIIGKPLGSIPELQHFEEMVKEAYRTNNVSIGGEDGAYDQNMDQVSGVPNSWQKQIQLYPEVDEDDVNTAHTLLARGTKLASSQLIIVFDDITEVIVAQRSVAWGEVARRLAHEIKNPLTPIQLSAERILHKLSGKIEAEQEEILTRSTKTIINQVQAMKQMVNDFRDFAKTPNPVLQPLDLNELVLEILGLYEGSKINVKIDPHCPKIMGDPTQLRQVIHNVLQNAQDACMDKGDAQEIEVRTEAVNYEVEPGQEAQMVRLTVVDNGPGLAPRILSRAFEPYITSKAKGTGLGLAVVKKILDEHDARIELKNREKDGVIRGAKISILFNRLASNNRAEN